jgi:hypothetical protein
MPGRSPTRIGKNGLSEYLVPLLNAYARALVFLQSLPAPISRREVTVIRNTDNPATPGKRGAKGHRIIFRMLVTALVEIHIHAKLTEILGYLRLAKFEMKREVSAAEIDKHITQIEQFITTISGWKLVSRLLPSSFANLFAGFLAPALAGIIGINVSKLSNLGLALADVFQAQGWEGIFIILIRVLSILWLMYVVLSIFVVPGFQVKRAIFSGGSAEINVFDVSSRSLRSFVKFSDFPPGNIYGLENRLFEKMKVWKKLEFPVDLAFNVSAYFMFGMTVFFTVSLLRTLALGSNFSWGDLIFFFLTWLLTITNTASGLRTYRLRKDDGNL